MVLKGLIEIFPCIVLRALRWAIVIDVGLGDRLGGIPCCSVVVVEVRLVARVSSRLSVLAVADAVVAVASNSKLGWLWLVIHLEPALPGAAISTVIGWMTSFWQL